MLRFILLDTTLFTPGDDPTGARTDLTWVLEALTQRDMQYLRDRPDTPLLYNSGVTYERPQQFNGLCDEAAVLSEALGPVEKHGPKVVAAMEIVQAALGGERFRDIGRIMDKGTVDCDNLACWRAAELRQNGIKASPFITWRKRPDGGTTYHVVVRWPDNTIEDPSLILGMGGPDRKEDRDEELRKNAERVQMAIDAAKKPKPTKPYGRRATDKPDAQLQLSDGGSFDVNSLVDDDSEAMDIQGMLDQFAGVNG